LINNALIMIGFIDEPLALAHNFFGTAIGMIHIMLPFLVLPLYASMKAINRDLIKAAANLGAAPIVVFWRVYLPLSLPGLFAGLLLVFVLCLGFYVTPAALGGGKVIMIAQSIENNISLYSNWGAASALGLVLLTLTSSILLVVGRLLPLRRFDIGI
jgi:ABC-type spermidine/putrescine transport system permease subunit I